MREQDEDLSDSHALCGETALPGACFDEHRSPDVHEAVWGDGAIGWMSSLPLEAHSLFPKDVTYHFASTLFPDSVAYQASAHLSYLSDTARMEGEKSFFQHGDGVGVG